MDSSPWLTYWQSISTGWLPGRKSQNQPCQFRLKSLTKRACVIGSSILSMSDNNQRQLFLRDQVTESVSKYNHESNFLSNILSWFVAKRLILIIAFIAPFVLPHFLFFFFLFLSFAPSFLLLIPFRECSVVCLMRFTHDCSQRQTEVIFSALMMQLASCENLVPVIRSFPRRQTCSHLWIRLRRTTLYFQHFEKNMALFYWLTTAALWNFLSPSLVNNVIWIITIDVKKREFLRHISKSGPHQKSQRKASCT